MYETALAGSSSSPSPGIANYAAPQWNVPMERPRPGVRPPSRDRLGVTNIERALAPDEAVTVELFEEQRGFVILTEILKADGGYV